jgi:drug/metabolite transporter (DMT)-like permease
MSNNARAILMMILAVFCFTSMDATAKSVAIETNTVMALWARYAGQALLVIVLVLPRIRSVAQTHYPVMQFLRSAFLLTATASFFYGLTRNGLAENTAIMDVNPVLVTLGAAIFLGEKLGPRRIAGIVAAMIGAMIIIRPGSSVFSLDAIFPLIAAFAYAGYSLTTRYVGSREDPWTSLFYAALLGALVITVLLPGHWQTPSLGVLLKMVLIAGLGTIAQLMMIRSLAIGEAAMLAPFAYVGLINATFWGIVAYGEYPDTWTICGALVIVVAGVYVWHRETRGAIPALPAEAKTPPEGL